MEILEQLDSHVTNLLQRMDQLKAENSELRSQLATLRSDLAALEENNRSLTDALAQEEAVRTKALTHLDMLLQRIQEFDRAE